MRPTRSDKERADGPVRRNTTLDISPSPVRYQVGLIPQLSRSQIAFRVLSLYADALCKVGEVINIKKFARTVTNKVSKAPFLTLKAKFF